MIWALIEIVLPMLLTFLFGLLVGWLWWRRRRTSGNDGLGTAALENSNCKIESAKADLSADEERSNDVDSDEALKMEAPLPEGRFMHEQALAKELTAANASIRSLVAELDVTRTRLQSSESRLRSAGVAVSEDSAGSGNVDVESSASDAAAGHDADSSGDAAREQLRQLQQKYQELETSQSIDKAELAKHHHLEARINDLTKELTENKRDLADAKKAASQQRQVNVDALTAKASDNTRVEHSADGSDADRGGTKPGPESGAEIEKLKSRIAAMTPAAEQAREYQSQLAVMQAKLQQSESKVRQIEQSGQRIDQLDSQLQTRLADELEKAQQQILDLEQKSSQSIEKAAELVRVRSRVAALETELGVANSRAEDAAKLKTRVDELESMLKGSEIKIANERLVEAEAQLRIANNRVAVQQQQINRFEAQTSVPAQDTQEVDSADSKTMDSKTRDLDSQELVARQLDREKPVDTRAARENQQLSASLRRQRGSPQESSERESAGGDTSVDADTQSADANTVGAETVIDMTDGEVPAEDKSVSSGSLQQVEKKPAAESPTESPAWQAGVTRFGTPAARHKDDLKVIRGIGPVLERTLNDAEIQTWDQLAALAADEIELIEQSMDFPGRMTRERWVEQATELVELYPQTENRPSGKKLLPKKG